MAILDAYDLIRNRHRDRDTADLLSEARRWMDDRAELEMAAAADPSSVQHLDESRAFIDTILTPIAAELERRRHLRASPYAAPWPATWPDHRANRREADRAEIDAIKSGLPVETFVETLTPTRLRRAGRQLVGLCPLHQERTPSFYVDPAQGVWYCHGACKQGGDVIELAMAVFGITEFRDAVTFLAPLANVERSRAVAGRG